ncbi:ABC transporter permease [Kineosporia sp. R_H_3]|uniref:ABC transporter permease n=1 Tax=Kineosporia sp. R_H_3 TaxID=1961848 RepID=UPI000B4B07F9|nr:ABC transporter permease [Kineosporia sp. R_H_3]
MSVGARLRRAAEVVALPVVLLAAWWVTSDGSESFYFPPLREVVAVLPETWFAGGADARIVSDVLPSLARLLTGYGLAAVVGVGAGLLIGSSPTLRALVEPVLEVFRAVPPPATVPLLVAVAGIDDLMKVLVIVFGCLWPILLNTVEGVRAVDPVLADTCRSYGIRGPGRVRSLVLRSASPQIMTGLRQALSVGIILMVISEMFAASNGIGFTVVQFQRTFAVPQMWTGIIVLGLLGVTLAWVFRAVEARVLRWYEGIRSAHRSGG